jgi:hypothetical protein
MENFPPKIVGEKWKICRNLIRYLCMPFSSFIYIGKVFFAIIPIHKLREILLGICFEKSQKLNPQIISAEWIKFCRKISVDIKCPKNWQVNEFLRFMNIQGQHMLGL